MEQGGRIYQPGTSADLPAEVPVTEPVASGAVAGQENGKKTSTSKKPAIKSRARKVERKTELHFAAASSMDPSEIRKRTERDLKFPDTDIPYYEAEDAFRDLVCSLMERDNRLNEDMFLRWNGLRHWIEDLEEEILALKSRGTTKNQEVPE